MWSVWTFQELLLPESDRASPEIEALILNWTLSAWYKLDDSFWRNPFLSLSALQFNVGECRLKDMREPKNQAYQEEKNGPPLGILRNLISLYLYSYSLMLFLTLYSWFCTVNLLYVPIYTELNDLLPPKGSYGT